MAAYIIADIVWSEPGWKGEYGRLAYPTLVAAGGKILAAGPGEILEGDWQLTLAVLIEFPSAEAARAWLDSPEYQPALQIRSQYARSNLVLVNGR